MFLGADTPLQNIHERRGFEVKRSNRPSGKVSDRWFATELVICSEEERVDYGTE